MIFTNMMCYYGESYRGPEKRRSTTSTNKTQDTEKRKIVKKSECRPMTNSNLLWILKGSSQPNAMDHHQKNKGEDSKKLIRLWNSRGVKIIFYTVNNNNVSDLMCAIICSSLMALPFALKHGKPERTADTKDSISSHFRMLSVCMCALALTLLFFRIHNQTKHVLLSAVAWFALHLFSIRMKRAKRKKRPHIYAAKHHTPWDWWE